MLRLLTVHACRDCPQNATLIEAAYAAGTTCSIDPVITDTAETRKAAELGLGLPVLIRDDGAMSKDAVEWRGAPKRPKKGVKSSK